MGRMGVTIFRRGEFVVRVDPSMLVILALLGYYPGAQLTDVLLWVAIAASCILVHELGHALAFAAFGSTPQALLYGMGGLTSARGPFTAARSVVISLAGPVAGFGLGGAIWLVGPGQSDLSRTIWYDGLFATFGFGILNLLPILPLDGGSAMLSTFKIAKLADAERIARYVSIAVAGAAGLAALRFLGGLSWVFPVLFVGQNLADLRRMRDEPTRERVRAAFQALLAGRPDDAARSSTEVLASRPGPDIAEVAAETLIWSHLALGRVADARAALAERPPRGAGDRRPVERLPEAAVAIAEGAGAPAVAVLAASLDKGEWGPPNVLVPLLERTGTLVAVQAAVGPTGADLLVRLQSAL